MANRPPVVVMVIGDVDPELTLSLVQTIKSRLRVADHTTFEVTDSCVTFKEFLQFCRVWKPADGTDDQVRAYAYRGWNALLAKIPELGAICIQCDQRWGVCRCADKGKLQGRDWLYYDPEMTGPGTILHPSSWNIPVVSLLALGEEQWARIHHSTRERLRNFANFARPD